MPELENVKEQKTAGYMSRTRMTNKERIKKDEEELKELEPKDYVDVENFIWITISNINSK